MQALTSARPLSGDSHPSASGLTQGGLHIGDPIYSAADDNPQRLIRAVVIILFIWNSRGVRRRLRPFPAHSLSENIAMPSQETVP